MKTYWSLTHVLNRYTLGVSFWMTLSLVSVRRLVTSHVKPDSFQLQQKKKIIQQKAAQVADEGYSALHQIHYS